MSLEVCTWALLVKGIQLLETFRAPVWETVACDYFRGLRCGTLNHSNCEQRLRPSDGRGNRSAYYSDRDESHNKKWDLKCSRDR